MCCVCDLLVFFLWRFVGNRGLVLRIGRREIGGLGRKDDLLFWGVSGFLVFEFLGFWFSGFLRKKSGDGVELDFDLVVYIRGGEGGVG